MSSQMEMMDANRAAPHVKPLIDREASWSLPNKENTQRVVITGRYVHWGTVSDNDIP